MKHSATIHNGRPVFDNPQAWIVDCAKLEGKKVSIELKRYFPNRTRSQNNYYQGVVISILATYMDGYTEEEVHEIIKQKFFSREIEIHGEKFLLCTTKTATTQEWEDKMRQIRQWASLEFGAYIPLPNEEEPCI